MGNRVYIQMDHTQIGDDLGFDVQVSDDYQNADPFFLSQSQLGTASDQDNAVAAVALSLDQGGDAADILNAAIENEDPTLIQYPDVDDADALLAQLMAWHAERERTQLDTQTAPAPPGQRGRRL